MRTAVLGLVAASLGTLSVAQNRTTEAGEAAITNPNVECTYYNQVQVTAVRESGDIFGINAEVATDHHFAILVTCQWCFSLHLGNRKHVVRTFSFGHSCLYPFLPC